MTDIKATIEWYMTAGVEDFCTDMPLNVLKQTVPAALSAQKKETRTEYSDAVQNTETQSESSEPPETSPYVYYQMADTNDDIRPATTPLAQINTEACQNAREICAKAQTLDDLRAMVENFEGCSLKFSANSTVFGYGNPQAEVMIVGEAPGADEDRLGEPFVGRSGHLLDKMLASVGLNRNDDCYITNILLWRPPGNRTPTSEEVAVCLPFLQRQIELIKPKIIFILGRSAANALLDNTDTISDLRGHFIDYVTESGLTIPTLSGFHPAYLLRTAAQKAKSWSDLLRLKRKLREL
ncbi:MAG: uracil-DNA glycosylase [Alphaproteobacteria bacterium]|nr:uracil-DNA glycosylase [Alphaproteobacteria bacterium]